MQITLLKGKIHRCTVTHADLDYEGSVTISEELMEAAQFLEGEQVHVWDVTNGARLITYAMRGPRDSGVVCLNGAAARHIHVGDLVIIAAFVNLTPTEAASWKPSIVFVDGENRMTAAAVDEVPGPDWRPSPAEGPGTQLTPIRNRESETRSTARPNASE